MTLFSCKWTYHKSVGGPLVRQKEVLLVVILESVECSPKRRMALYRVVDLIEQSSQVLQFTEQRSNPLTSI